MPISAQFTADFSQFTSAAEGAQQALGGVQTAAEGIDLNAHAERAGAAIVNLAGTVQAFATDYINAFAEEEAATARLTEALRTQGSATADTIANYQAMAEQFQTTTRYSDDAVTAAQTALTQIGRIGPEQMRPAIQAAADLAASLGIGLEEAAKKLAIVIGSDGAKLGTLAKYLGDVDLKGKSAAEMFEIFRGKFGGAALADMETGAGKVENLANKFDDFKGKVGQMLAETLTPLLDAFQALSPSLQTVIVGVGGLTLALAPVAIAFGTLVTAIGPLVPLLATAIPAALSGLAVLMGPAGLVVGGIVGVYLAFKNWNTIVDIARNVYLGIKTWLVDGFTTLVAPVFRMIDALIAKFKFLYNATIGHSYIPDMVNGIADEFRKLDRVMVRPAIEAADAVTGAMGGLAGPSLATAGGGGVSVQINVTQPLGTPEAIARAVSQALTPAILQGRKLSGL